MTEKCKIDYIEIYKSKLSMTHMVSFHGLPVRFDFCKNDYRPDWRFVKSYRVWDDVNNRCYHFEWERYE